MRYALIFSVDVPEDENPDSWSPTGSRIRPTDDGPWEQTEGDGSFSTPDSRLSWTTGHHRKWVADLSEDELRDLIDTLCLQADGEGTSLGAVGIGFAHSLVFLGEQSDYALVEVSVTPHCDTEELPDWLREHGQSVPISLTDDPKQGYLFGRKVMDRRTPWEAVSKCLQETFR